MYEHCHASDRKAPVPHNEEMFSNHFLKARRRALQNIDHGPPHHVQLNLHHHCATLSVPQSEHVTQHQCTEYRSQCSATCQKSTYLKVVSLAAGVALCCGAHLLHVGLVEERVRNEDHALHQMPRSPPVRALFYDMQCNAPFWKGDAGSTAGLSQVVGPAACLDGQQDLKEAGGVRAPLLAGGASVPGAQQAVVSKWPNAFKSREANLRGCFKFKV